MIFRRMKITDPQNQVNEILLHMGEVSILKFNSPMAADEMQPEVVWSKFEEYGLSSQNIRIARLALRNIIQNTDASTNEPDRLEVYISRICIQAAQCDFHTTKYGHDINCKLDNKIIEQIIVGTLENAVQIAKNHEASMNHMKQLKITQGNAQTIDALQETTQCTKCRKGYKPYNECPVTSTVCRN